MDQKTSIREFVRNNLAVLDDESIFTDEADIFEQGLVDSPFAIQLISFIEKQFGIRVEDCDLDINNFRSVQRIASFVSQRQAGAVASTEP